MATTLPLVVEVPSPTTRTATTTTTTITTTTVTATKTTITTSRTTTATATTTTVTTTTRTTTSTIPCGLIEDNIDYPGNDLDSVPNISSARLCCQVCSRDPQCRAWTWGKARNKSFTDICYMKGDQPRPVLTKVVSSDFTSGQPLRDGKSIEAKLGRPGQSLYCYALVRPNTYEVGLLTWQFSKGASLFGCDEYAVVSNKKVNVATGLAITIVDNDLKCKIGGEFMTALNTDIFIAVWGVVIEAGRFRLHDWTVKVDPDAVFFPSRLRRLVAHHPEAGPGVYLNNCKYGLHGPIEVFSRNAVAAWAEGMDRCTRHFRHKCKGPCLWGEDLYIDQCLWKVLDVKRENETHLLVEDHCDPPKHWKSCSDSAAASFHPFKDVFGYGRCWSKGKEA